MQIIECNKQYSYSINFVDENNILIGYDIETSCCEHTDYMITDINGDDFDDDLKPYVFSILDDRMCEIYGIVDIDTESGGIVTYELHDKHNIDNKIYLTLYNIQNGYYRHEYIVQKDGIILKRDYL